MRDVVAGGLVAALAAFVLLVIPYQADTTAGGVVTSASLPSWTAWTLLVLGGLLAVSGLRTRTAGRAPPTTAGSARVALTLLVGVVYTASMPWIGFLAATPLAIGAVAAVFGARRWLPVLLLAVLGTAAVHLFFTYAMQTPLPIGRLWR